MCQAQFQAEVMDELSINEYQAHITDLQQQFTDYLYSNYMICNGESLIEILESGDALADFLDLNGLPADTEINL
ncbi:hypothetical protein UFOVP774_44 [uncultured Caudovirales phage]|uniref:Uncharacterized protein n=1 Tax=uncultured Caudovirales phage TaxID=2100421 RepID=A0A6J5NN85_9CAUD|nr:hypothetical protein UFOVP774_44 [uncultured Caudovirales phage]